MAILVDGKYKWQVGDIAYYYFDEFIKGQFVIQVVLTNNCYRGRLLNAAPGDFAYEFMATSKQLSRVV